MDIFFSSFCYLLINAVPIAMLKNDVYAFVGI